MDVPPEENIMLRANSTIVLSLRPLSYTISMYLLYHIW